MDLNLKNYLIVFLFLLCFSFTGHSQLIEPKNPTIKTSGDILSFAIPTSTFISTLILKDKKGTWQFTEGFVFNEAVTLGLKYALNKPRPFHGGDKAFPSGHTSVTFQSAAFIHERYGFKYSIPVYALAGFTAFSRINAQKHDGYDILAGAAVGIGSSLLFTTPYAKEHMQLTFSSYDDQYLVNFTYQF